MLEIVPFSKRYAKAFKALNQWWIEQYFTMEPQDFKVLEHPESYIVANGGHILVALWNDKPVGVCALLQSDLKDYDFELAKMGVSPNAQGKGIGLELGRSVIEKARLLGAKKIYLESSTLLLPALQLYRKLGFKEIEGLPSPYSRSDIQMELKL
ncbi:GNAT family N-acetyltransferase [uncultured Croceitalea sp.]|uniref:GNAT family N-acetyltransferase n=1 Tax=uncultured Croceitalea sp. TaxID=1798908 RepID=UPI00330628A8